MKKFSSFLLFSFLVILVHGQTLFTYGKYSVNTKEFLKAYNKNKTPTSDNDKALREYLDLYINFKLKVQEAKDLHLDTLPSLEADLQNFRNQIQDNYLKDNQEVNALDEEAFLRSQKDVHVLHFFAPVKASLSPADTAKIYTAIYDLYRQLELNNKTAEEALAMINANGPTVEENDLGFITAFTLPYEFENIVYKLKPGQSGIPYRTKKGWHIFKNVEERHAVGKTKIAQILFAVPEGFADARARTKKIADSVYNELIKGANFDSLAKEYSNDRMTYMNGGIMPEFGVAKYDQDFEKIAFSLKKDNEISKPFETRFGYHIIKRISASPVPSDTKSDKDYMENLKKEVLQDSRIERAKKKFISDILPKIGYKKYKVNEDDLWKVTDRSILANKNITSGIVNEKTILFSYNNNGKAKVSDWILYLRNLNETTPGINHEVYKKMFPQFLSASALENYKNRLQDFNPDFKNQMIEFKEGNLLFEIMERKVWGKASADSIGLVSYYNKHKEKYWWDASADALIFSCANENVAKNDITQLEKGKSWKDIIEENSTQTQADSGRFELPQIPVSSSSKINFYHGLITPPVINKNDGTAVFAKILKVYPAHQPRNFNDARGLVINDYQNFLEQKWIEHLKKKYPVRVNEKVFQSLLN